MSSEPDRDKDGYGNLFKMIDGIVFELNRTKRMFMIMILSIMIIPPVSLFVTSLLFVPPFEHEGEHSSLSERRPDGAGHFLQAFLSLRNVPLIISVVWLGVGIRQWFVISKWTKGYERYKKRRDEVERKLDEGSSGSDLSDDQGEK
jgi:hypothetical protein